jgi:hypothetical protein
VSSVLEIFNWKFKYQSLGRLFWHYLLKIASTLEYSANLVPKSFILSKLLQFTQHAIITIDSKNDVCKNKLWSMHFNNFLLICDRHFPVFFC